MLIQTEGGYHKMEKDDSLERLERDDSSKRNDMSERYDLSEKGDRRQIHNRSIYVARKNMDEEKYISPKEKEAAIKDKKRKRITNMYL